MTRQEVFFIDCIEGMQLYVQNESVDLAFADPPFAINFNRSSGMYGYGVSQEKRVFYSDSMSKEEYLEFCRQWMKLVFEKLRDGGIFILMICWNHVADLIKIAENIGFTQINHLIWKFEFAVYTSRKYATAHYHYPIFVKGTEKTEWTFNNDADTEPINGKSRRDREKYKIDVESKIQSIIEHPEDRANNINKISTIIEELIYNNKDTFQIPDFFSHIRRLTKRYTGIEHPCKLNEDVTKKLFLEWSNEGDLILDVFGGSCTGLVSAFITNRNYIAFEIGNVDKTTGKEIYSSAVLEMIKRRVCSHIENNIKNSGQTSLNNFYKTSG